MARRAVRGLRSQGGGGRRRRKPKGVIDLGAAWNVQTGSKRTGDRVKVRATPLQIDLRESTILESLGQDMVDRMREVVQGSRAKPKRSTRARRKRRGEDPGAPLGNVSGGFLRSIKHEITKHGHLRVFTDYLRAGVRGALQRRLKGLRPGQVKKWLVESGRLQKLMRTTVVKTEADFNAPGRPGRRNSTLSQLNLTRDSRRR